SVLSGKWGTMVLIALIVSLITGVCGGLSWVGIGAVALLIVTGPLFLGEAMQFLRLIRGQRVDVSKVFDGFKNFGNAFLLSLLNNIFIALWSLLFVIPGIIKSYAYSMSFYILADNPNMDANTARVRSIELMRGNKWRLFCLDFSFIGWYLLCGLTFGILTFWVAPYHMTARTLFYQEILREKGVMYYGADYREHNGGNANGGTVEAEKTKTDGSENVNGGGAAGNNGSVFGTGYTPDPFMELGGTPSQSEADALEKKDDGQPPLNADDL
ncbi:MAG: DUF975 family protein, partial [Clostridia bacterium]|nr:DUF975 family protein [Clostridia bacterium]